MRLSVTTKIFVGLAVVVLTFGLVSIYAVAHVHRISQDLELTSQTYLPLTKVATQLETVQKHRARDTGRLLEEREARVQTILISIARLHFPKIVREKLSMGRELARSGRERSADPADALFLQDIEDRLGRLESLYDGYDRAANDLYALLDPRPRADGADPLPDGSELSGRLRRAERLIDRELKELGRTLDRKITEQVRATEAAEDRAAFAILTLSLAAVLVALLVTVFVQRTLRPIRRLTEGVQAVRGGNFARRVEVTSDDEVGGLAREFNAMAQALEDRDAELTTKRSALLRAERLAAVGRMAAQVSHEIRNPLSSIGLNADLMGDELAAATWDDPARAAEANDLLAAIASEIDRLTEITEEYLRFARMPRPQLASEDLNDLVRGLLSFMQGELVAAKVTVRADLAPDLGPVLADEAQLRQALLNLVRNAREAMADGGVLTITTRSRGDRVVIDVSDTGPGIPEQDRERIFDPFFSTKEGGTGLGLALTQQIVAEHEGSIRCESRVSHGTRFVIELRSAGVAEAGLRTHVQVNERTGSAAPATSAAHTEEGAA